MEESRSLTSSKMCNAVVFIGCLFILLGGVLELYNIGRGGTVAYVLTRLSLLFGVLYFLLYYLGQNYATQYITYTYFIVILYEGLVIWQQIGGSTVPEATFYNGISDWITFIGSLILFFGMLLGSARLYTTLNIERDS